MLGAMSANEGYDPFDLTGMTEDELDRLEAAGERVDVVPGPAPSMTPAAPADAVHGEHLEYLVASNTAGVQVDFHVVQSTSMVLAGATKS